MLKINQKQLSSLKAFEMNTGVNYDGGEVVLYRIGLSEDDSGFIGSSVMNFSSQMRVKIKKPLITERLF